MIGFRTESFSGLEIRNLIDIMHFEFFELYNVDVFEELLNKKYIQNCDLKKEIKKLITQVDSCESISLDYNKALKLVKNIIFGVGRVKNTKLIYGLWLASLEIVKDVYIGRYQDNSPLKDAIIDVYEIGDGLELDDMGEGKLFGFKDFPKIVFSGTFSEVEIFLQNYTGDILI